MAFILRYISPRSGELSAWGKPFAGSRGILSAGLNDEMFTGRAGLPVNVSLARQRCCCLTGSSATRGSLCACQWERDAAWGRGGTDMTVQRAVLARRGVKCLRDGAVDSIVWCCKTSCLFPPKMLVQTEPQRLWKLVPALGRPIRSPTGHEPSCRESRKVSRMQLPCSEFGRVAAAEEGLFQMCAAEGGFSQFSFQRGLRQASGIVCSDTAWSLLAALAICLCASLGRGEFG